jgi:hypothetical protein
VLQALLLLQRKDSQALLLLLALSVLVLLQRKDSQAPLLLQRKD